MNWTALICVLVYFVIGTYFVNLCDSDDDIARMLVFITWPLILGMFILCIVVFLIVGLVYAMLAFIRWFIQTVTGGDSNGVV